MGNMSYCRFQNTVSDLEDCLDTLNGLDEYYQYYDDLSEDEQKALLRLIDICRDIVQLDDYDEHPFRTDNLRPESEKENR
jgi:hypothetical protein